MERIETVRMGEQDPKELAEVEEVLEGPTVRPGLEMELGVHELEREPSITARPKPKNDCLHSKAEPEPTGARSRSSTVDTSKSTLTKEERLDLNRYSKVDDDIIRGVPLRRSLKGMGYLAVPAGYVEAGAACQTLRPLAEGGVFGSVSLAHLARLVGTRL